MPIDHTVKQGEHLPGIAKKYGFSDPQKLWDLPENKTLKDQRENLNELYPGDVVHIPDPETKTADAATKARHTYKLKGGKLTLRLVLHGVDKKPISDTKCTLSIDSQTWELTTDNDGKIEQVIPKTAQKATLSFLDTQHTLLIGHLDPVTEVSGQQARLANLGYYQGPIDGQSSDRFLSAVEEFQCDQKLTVDGICGPNTRKKLIDIYGC